MRDLILRKERNLEYINSIFSFEALYSLVFLSRVSFSPAEGKNFSISKIFGSVINKFKNIYIYSITLV